MNKTVKMYIDAENMSSDKVSSYLEIAKTYGNVIKRNVYGDFSLKKLTKWCSAEKDYALDLVQVTSTGKGKSTTDMKLIIDLLSDFKDDSRSVYILISNDQDFVILAKKIKGQNGNIISINRDGNVCFEENFTKSHNIEPKAKIKPKTKPKAKSVKPKEKAKPKIKEKAKPKQKISNKAQKDELLLIIDNIITKNNNNIPLSNLCNLLYEEIDKEKVLSILEVGKNGSIGKKLNKLPKYTVKNNSITIKNK